MSAVCILDAPMPWGTAQVLSMYYTIALEFRAGITVPVRYRDEIHEAKIGFNIDEFIRPRANAELVATSVFLPYPTTDNTALKVDVLAWRPLDYTGLLRSTRIQGVDINGDYRSVIENFRLVAEEIRDRYSFQSI